MSLQWRVWRDAAPDEAVLDAMRDAASWPGCTAESVAQAAIEARDAQIREKIREFAAIDGWPLSQRDALIRYLGQ